MTLRRAFTLIELLAIVAIIGIMVAAGVMSVRQGQSGVKLKSATRDIFATMRHARSMALVSRKESRITYSTKHDGDDVVSQIKIETAPMFSGNDIESAETLDGRRISLETGEEVVEEKKDVRIKGFTVNGESPVVETESQGEGQTIEDILLQPISSDVMRGIRLKVEKGEALATTYRTEAQTQSKISVFSTSDYIFGKYKSSSDTAKKAAAEGGGSTGSEAVSASSADLEDQEEVKVYWEANGRVEPHKVWVYLDGKSHETGYCISVDQFGGAKVLTEEDEDR